MLVSQWPTRSHQSSDSWPIRPIGCVAAEARSWHRRCADEDIPMLLKQTIRLDPFVIRRGYPDDDATGTRPAMS